MLHKDNEDRFLREAMKKNSSSLSLEDDKIWYLNAIRINVLN